MKLWPTCKCAECLSIHFSLGEKASDFRARPILGELLYLLVSERFCRVRYFLWMNLTVLLWNPQAFRTSKIRLYIYFMQTICNGIGTARWWRQHFGKILRARCWWITYARAIPTALSAFYIKIEKSKTTEKKAKCKILCKKKESLCKKE